MTTFAYPRNLCVLPLHIIFAIAVTLTFASHSHAQATQRTLIRTGHLLDVTSGAEPAGQTIIVTGDRITAIAPTASTPAGAGDSVVDLSNMYVLPGLITI